MGTWSVTGLWSHHPVGNIKSKGASYRPVLTGQRHGANLAFPTFRKHTGAVGLTGSQWESASSLIPLFDCVYHAKSNELMMWFCLR